MRVMNDEDEEQNQKVCAKPRCHRLRPIWPNSLRAKICLSTIHLRFLSLQHIMVSSSPTTELTGAWLIVQPKAFRTKLRQHAPAAALPSKRSFAVDEAKEVILPGSALPVEVRLY